MTTPLEQAAEKVLTVITNHQKAWESGSQGQAGVLDALMDLEAALQSYGEQCAKAALEMAAKECDEMGAYEQEGFGLDRGAQNYFRARNAIRNLDPAQIVKEMNRD